MSWTLGGHPARHPHASDRSAAAAVLPEMSWASRLRTALLPTHADDRRAWRVVLLTAIIVLLSAVDLRLTLTYIDTGGFAEANPIARWVMQANCQWVLAAFKFSMLSITCCIFYFCRHRRSVELGAWLGVLLMAWLMVRWQTYAEHASEFAAAFDHNGLVVPDAYACTTWVQFDR